MLTRSLVVILWLACAATVGAQATFRTDCGRYMFSPDHDAPSGVLRGRNLTAVVCCPDSPGETPGVELSAWDGECSFAVCLAAPRASTSDFVVSRDTVNDPARVSLVSHDLTHRLLIAPAGGLEWAIVLAGRPDKNMFVYPIETTGLDFWYQDTLTESERREGSTRPDSVVGSWAVYRSRDRGERRRESGVSVSHGTGKFCHIYRPRAWDSGRDTVWCSLDIDPSGGRLTVTVPSDFLEHAVYPVIVDPHFGMDQQGASSTNFVNTYNYGIALTDYQYAASTGDHVDSLVMYFVYGADSAALAVYATDQTHKPTGSPVGQSTRLGSTANNQWRSASVDISLTGGVVYTLAEAENMSDGTRVAYDAEPSSCSRCSGASFCDPWSEAGLRAYCFSAYVVFTNSSADPTPARRRKHSIMRGLAQ